MDGRPLLLIGTYNRHKLGELKAMLADLPVEIAGAEILPSKEPVLETGESFRENARAKALEFARRALALPEGDRPLWVLADDSGLEVERLRGEPGVRSARYAGENAGDRANNELLLRRLAGVPPEERAARFVCALALAEVPATGGEPRIALEVEGECRGRIAEAPRGRGGFGYDPLFIPEEAGRTFAEMSPEEKNRRSHRFRALEAFRQRFAELLSERTFPRG